MQEIYANGNSSEIKGYMQTWYHWDREFDSTGELIRIGKTKVGLGNNTTEERDTINLIELVLKYDCISVGQMDCRPLGFPSKTEAYLTEGALVMVSETKKPTDPNVKINIPPKIITIIANQKEQLWNAAKKLMLPLERIAAAKA